MCQQWLSVLGVLLEVVGFLLVAREWYHVFKLDILARQNRIEEDYLKAKAEEEGREPHENLDYTMWSEFQRLLTADVKYRKTLFVGGGALIVVGLLLQAIGSWPGGLFGSTNC